MVERLVHFLMIKDGGFVYFPPRKMSFKEGVDMAEAFKEIDKIRAELECEQGRSVAFAAITDLDGTLLFANDDFDQELVV